MLIDGVTNKIRRNKPTVIISIGGGSVIDAGKAISAMLPVNTSVYEFLEGVGSGKVHPGTKVPFIAVPTTSGTGSEATKNAVLSDVGKDGFKASLRHENFVPDIALVDPGLSLGCPGKVTSACGMDAFTQLLESYVSVASSPVTDALALSGLKRIIRSLLRVVEHPTDLDAREDMSYAALISGIILANSGLGIVHGIASVLGGHFDVPHGIICGTLLGPSVKKNIEMLTNTDPYSTALNKYAEVGKIISNETGKKQEEYTHLLVEMLYDWTIAMRLPRLSVYGIKEKDIEEIARNSTQKQNPVELNQTDIESVIEERL